MVNDLTQKVVVAMYGHYSPRAKVKIGRAEAAIEVVEADVRPLVEKMREALVECDGYIIEVRPAKSEWEDELQARNEEAIAEADKFLGKGE